MCIEQGIPGHVPESGGRVSLPKASICIPLPNTLSSHACHFASTSGVWEMIVGRQDFQVCDGFPRPITLSAILQ